MDPSWDSKRRHMFLNTVDNPKIFLQNDHHRSLKTKILSLYGGDSWEEICNLEKTRIKIERRVADLKFLKECRDPGRLPFHEIDHYLWSLFLLKILHSKLS